MMADKKPVPADPNFIGRRVYLRPETPLDVESLWHWRMLSGLQTLSSRPMVFLTPAEAVERMKKVEKDAWSQRFGIVRKDDKQLVGAINMFNYNPLNRSIELGITVDPDERKNGYATDAIRVLCNYLFRFRGVNKVHAQTAEFNKGAVKLLEKLRFQRDGVLRDHYFHDGEFHAGYIYSLLAFELD